VLCTTLYQLQRLHNIEWGISWKLMCFKEIWQELCDLRFIFLEWLIKTKKSLISQDSRSSNRNSNRKFPEYVAGVPTTTQRRSMNLLKLRTTSGAGIAQWYGAGPQAGWLGVRVPAETGNFSLHHRVQTGSGAHPASYPMGIRGKAAAAWSWPYLHLVPRSRMCGAIPSLPNMPSWRGAQLKHRDNLTFYLY
jgi:hypothetical protein